MKKRVIALLSVCALTTMCFTGCSKKDAPVASEVQETTEDGNTDSSLTENNGADKKPVIELTDGDETEAGDEQGMVGMANPWVEISEEEADEICMRLFKAPEGAKVQGWLKCEELGDPDKGLGPMVQLDFELDGMNFTARAQQGASEDADISGIFTEWTVGPEDVTLANWGGGNMAGKMYRAIGESGYIDLITWYDVEIGIKYSLSVAAKDLDGFDIQAVAEQMYSDENEPYGNVPDVPEEIEKSDEFAGYLKSCADSGLYIEVEIKDGVAVTVSISA
ncbi:MAG: hypothetical protein K6G27_05600 [Lachnospiraceae bacterium]|nr:hypothetical protein [Lachnospiraceae bacterium]